MQELIGLEILIEHNKGGISGMWNIIVERFPGMLTVICTILAYVIPFFIYKINQRLHKDVDPPWKNDEKK